MKFRKKKKKKKKVKANNLSRNKKIMIRDSKFVILQ